MIESIILENFRAWKGRHDIPLRQLTLIFGPNSAGKSSIFHALGLLRQTLERASGTDVPMISVDRHATLGNFANLVYGHDTSLSIWIGLSYRVDTVSHLLPSDVGSMRRVLAEFRLRDPAEGSGVLSRFIMEVGEKYRLAFTRSPRGFMIEHEAHDSLWMLLNRPELSAHARPDAFADALGELTSASSFWFTRGVPGIVKFVGEDGDDSQSMDSLKQDWMLWIDDSSELENTPSDGLIQARLLVHDAWARYCEAFSDELFDVLGRIRHLGPLRQPPDRIAPTSLKGESGDDVGHRGENIVPVLAREDVRNSVNRTLARMQYEVHIGGEGIDDPVAGAIRWLRLKHLPTNVWVSPCDVGFGISQSLPIIAQLAGGRGLIHVIEQPEIHLHPRLHVEMGQVLVDAIQRDDDRSLLWDTDTSVSRKMSTVNRKFNNTQIICETHSPELYLRVIRRVGEQELAHECVCILYVSPPLEWMADELQENDFIIRPDSSTIRTLQIDEHGALLDRWPHGFFDERIDELLGGT